MKHLNEPWTQEDLSNLVAMAPMLDADFAAEILNQTSELPGFVFEVHKRWKVRFLSHLSHCAPNLYGYSLWSFLDDCVRKANISKTATTTDTDASTDDWAARAVVNSVLVTPQLGKQTTTDERPRPPLNAEFVLHLLLPDDRVDDVVGDLEERFHQKVDRLGVRHARLWYYKQIASSLWPYAKAAAKRLSSGATVKLIAFILRLTGQSSIADELTSARRVSNGKS